MAKQLDIQGNIYNINHTIRFIGEPVSDSSIEKAFEFAYDMTFGDKGNHRLHRSGGTLKRKNGELFANTFQGKLSEYVFYEKCLFYDLNVNPPDDNTYGLGVWDDFDFVINSKHVSIKSMAFFSNLLLLEINDWNKLGEYQPSKITYDYHVVIRIRPDIKSLLKNLKLFYSEIADKGILKSSLKKEKFQYQIVGYISKQDLIDIINNRLIIPRGSLLNGRIPMDASNYYCQSGDFRNIDELFNLLAL